MKVKYEIVYTELNGLRFHHYIQKTKKHWWNKWRVTMSGDKVARFQKDYDGTYYQVV